MQTLFIIALFFTIYSYAIYPILIHFLGRIIRKEWQKQTFRPVVTIIISAYNEEKDIENKINNSLQLNYPEDKLEIIVSSDGSADRTDEIVKGIDDKRLRLMSFTGRIGKTACLNKVIPEASGKIILFTDANSMFTEDTLHQIVDNFFDPDVGAVTGWTKYRNTETGEETTGTYAKLEKITKRDESRISSCVGADGAIFAIRKELYMTLGANDINDFIIPLNVIEQGKRVVLDPAVFCIEEETKGLKNIFKRQVRITTRTAWAIRRNIQLLNFTRHGSFSFFLLSHKVLRLMTPFFFLATFILNFFILNKSPLYALTLGGQLLFLTAALTGMAGILQGKIFSFCKYFLITCAAYFLGCMRMLVGIEDIIWTPKR